jgi:HSP20 family protein
MRSRAPQSLFVPMMDAFQDIGWHPLADIYRTRDGWLIKFDLAGVRTEDVRVSVRGNRLTVEGVRRDWGVEQSLTHYAMEISYSRFERSIELPCDLERAQIQTSYRDGMLLVGLTC